MLRASIRCWQCRWSCRARVGRWGYDGRRERASIYTLKQEVAGARLGAAIEAIEQTRARWALGDARVEVIYEAGQDGFWIARALEGRGYAVRVVDPASIPVERHARQAKTDRLDVLRLLSSLMGWLRGEHDRMRVIRMPDEAAEAQRHWARSAGCCRRKSASTGIGCASCCARSVAGSIWSAMWARN